MNSGDQALVYFDSERPPAPEELKGLIGSGIEWTRDAPDPGFHWSLELRHEHWGSARLAARREAQPLDRTIVDYSNGLQSADRERALRSRSALSLLLMPSGDTVTRRRKRLLRFVNAVMGGTGLCGMDVASLRIWVPETLEDELAHDAELDVSSLYSLHAVEDEAQRVRWLHTHGLAEAGGFDFDILDPSKDLLTLSGEDVLRSLAHFILEGLLPPDGTIAGLVSPGPAMRLVPVAVFDSSAPPEQRALRSAPDHHVHRSVACDPAPWWDFGGWTRPRASRLLRDVVMEKSMVVFSRNATEVMARRARATLPILRGMIEMGRQQLRAGVKIGLPIPGDDGREHCWFEVEAIRENTIVCRAAHDANDVPLREGDRREYPVEQLSDWALALPFGSVVTPRNLRARRTVEKVKAILRKHVQNGGPEGGP